MHNLQKIRLFRVILWAVYPLALLLVWPFARAKKKSSGNLFFFFDRYAIGGAQRIHLDILEAVKDQQKNIFFTRKSPNDKLKHAFYSVPMAEKKDISFWCDNLLFRIFTVHYYAFYLNRHHGAKLLSANSTFFYDMLPFISKKLLKTELLHNFSFGKKGMEFFGLANHKYFDYRIVYDSYTLSNIKQQYLDYAVDDKYLDRLLFIEPGVESESQYQKNFDGPIRVLYAGRGGYQKRVWLLNKIVEHCIDKLSGIEFHFAGPIDKELTEKVKRNAQLHGQVGSIEKMRDLYNGSHIIILTSAFEGFPMVIKEGMAQGVVPLVTALQGNKMHLQHLKNALLIEAVEDEKKVVSEGIALLEFIVSKPEELQRLSLAAFNYAKENFSKQKFLDYYRDFLLKGETSAVIARPLLDRFSGESQ